MAATLGWPPCSAHTAGVELWAEWGEQAGEVEEVAASGVSEAREQQPRGDALDERPLPNRYRVHAGCRGELMAPLENQLTGAADRSNPASRLSTKSRARLVTCRLHG